MTKFTAPLTVGVLDAATPEVKITGGIEGEGVLTTATTVDTTAAGFVLIDVITTAGTTVPAKIPFFLVT